MAISNFLLTITDIKGGSKELPDAIDVESWSYGLMTPTDVFSGQATGRRQIGALNITKWIDKSSPILIQALVENRLLTKVKLELRHMDNGKSVKYYELELKDARVASITVKGPGPLAVPTEVISIAYQQGTCTFTNGGVMVIWDTVGTSV